MEDTSPLIPQFDELPRHCCALVLASSAYGQVARPGDRVATGTFVMDRGRVFLITCDHVVTQLREAQAGRRADSERGFDIYSRGQGRWLRDYFRSLADPNGRPDLAMMEVRPSFAEELGCIPTPAASFLSMPPEHGNPGVVFGFPNELQSITEVPGGIANRRRCLRLIARVEDADQSRLLLFDETAKEPAAKDLSGISGGPVFWVRGQDTGLMAIAVGASATVHGAEAGDFSRGSQGKVMVRAEVILRNSWDAWVAALGLPPAGNAGFLTC